MEWWVPGAGERGEGVSVEWEQSLNWDGEKLLEMDGGNGYTIM